MTERNTKTFIGAFVLGAIALLIALILLLGSGTLGSKNPTFVLYFKTSLKGLIQGSPVYFKGIRVGKVSSIQIQPELDSARFQTPVVIEIEKNTATLLLEGGKERDLFENTELLNKLIYRGLRGKLGITSILTGQLCVELDIMKNAVPVDIATLRPYKGSPEIPTQLSPLDAALNTLENIPIQEIIYDVMGSVKSVSTQFQKLDLAGLVDSLKLTSDIAREQIQGLSTLRDDAGKAISAYAGLAATAKKDLQFTMGHMNKALDSVETMAGDTSRAMAEARSAMAEVRQTASDAGSIFSEDSAPVLEFSQTMLSLRKAAQSLSDLATLLEIKPNSLIFGRSN
ncbi:MAG: MCE family protein [Mailhella sp.]|nr:MCE family protein [Mailhella sp.]